MIKTMGEHPTPAGNMRKTPWESIQNPQEAWKEKTRTHIHTWETIQKPRGDQYNERLQAASPCKDDVLFKFPPEMLECRGTVGLSCGVS